ncbi:MAG: NAD-dependent epimerase/dehydratase family protein [Pseudomonadota bacterium]|nr:NAD-dependent epimerase/dehydratase family protein [Pseudomonadota bacterium]
MRTLITGATGFVGSAVARKLLERGGTVRALCRARSDTRNLSGLPLEIVTGDLTDAASLKRAVAGCEALFHVAADYRLWTPDPEVLYRSNVQGTRDLMGVALEAGVRRIVYTSSVATLGLNPEGAPADELTPVSIDHMIGHYKRSKYLAEQEVSKLVVESTLPAVIVNPSTPVGPRDIKPTPTGRMVLDAAAGRMPAFVDTGLNIAHVDDVAEGHLLAFERGETGERYILGGENLSLRDILAQVADITGGRPPRIRLPHNLVLPLGYVTEAWARLFGTGEPRLTVDGVRMAKKWMYFSSHKAHAQLGYEPRPAREALADAVTWFRDNRYF